ncbi:uncharacterized protein LOC142325481 [Lycorma delicatula]|uniref:uncharacterized protein LOC142325481 n=1 Tax=Lycorma delicatula TaxID=130591 RepID=UPI003F515350
MAYIEDSKVDLLKENAGIHVGKVSSAWKNVVGSVKKGKVLSDVKNIVSMKENALKKKLQNEENSCKKNIKIEFKKDSRKAVAKEPSTTFVPAYAPAPVVDDTVDSESDVDIDDCPSCIFKHDDYDWLHGLNWPKDIQLTDDAIDILCLEPCPQTRNAPLPDVTIDDLYKTFCQPESPTSMKMPECDESFFLLEFKLPDEFYDERFEIPPVFND